MPGYEEELLRLEEEQAAESKPTAEEVEAAEAAATAELGKPKLYAHGMDEGGKEVEEWDYLNRCVADVCVGGAGWEGLGASAGGWGWNLLFGRQVL